MAIIVQRYSHSLTLATLFFVSLSIALGFWQLERTEEKRQLLDTFGASLAAPPVPLDEVRDDWQNQHYRKVSVSGYFLADKIVILENQFAESRVGLHQYQAFATNSGLVVLVNLGWIAAAEELIPRIDGELQLQALMRSPPEVGLRLGSLETLPFTQPTRTPYLDINWLEKRLQLSLEPYILLPDDENLDIDRWTAVRMPPEKHLSYAITWFTLAFFLSIAFLLFTFRKEPEA